MFHVEQQESGFKSNGMFHVKHSSISIEYKYRSCNDILNEILNNTKLCYIQ